MFGPIRNPSDDLAVSQGCRFDEAAGLRVCAFVERFCRQSKGRWAGEPIKLIDWQRDLLMRGFGWRKADGKRRFRTIHVELPKKNGKSTLVSALALYLQTADDENAAEVYLNAVDRAQADIVYEEAVRMIEASPQLSSRLSVSRYHGTITDPRKYGVIRKNSGDTASKDGANASGVIFDEIHRFGVDRKMWDVYTFAGISREQPIKIVITTAGEEAEGIWHELRQHSEEVNAGLRPDISHLGVVYRASTESDPAGADDLDDPATWKRCNPSMGHTMTLADFEADFNTAKLKGGAEWANFLRLRLGIVMRAEGKYLRPSEWDACNAEAAVDDETQCFAGLDLSSHDDLSAFVLITGDFDDGFGVQCRFWLPEDGIVDLERKHGRPYRVWANEGLIKLTPGNTIDQDFIEAEILKLVADRNFLGLGVDRWEARRMATNLLNNHGLPVELVGQGYASLSDPTKTLKDLIVGGKIRHGGHPILRWHALNAVERRDPAGNIKLDKEKSRQKIDGMAALVNALAMAIARGGSGVSVYETRGLIQV